MMTGIIKPPFDIREEEDPFLVPPGQSGSYVDALANAQRQTAESGIIVEIVDRDTRVTVIITEVRHVR